MNESSFGKDWALLFFSKILFIYLIKSTHTRAGGRGRGRGTDSLLSQEPNVGLHPQTLGSWAEPKAVA